MLSVFLESGTKGHQNTYFKLDALLFTDEKILVACTKGDLGNYL
jgi:hypothetical protein